MLDAAAALPDHFPELLARLPADLDLDRLARETKAIQRRREVADGAGLLRIALARGPGGLSLRQTAAWASLLGIAELSSPGLKYRLNQATGFLAAYRLRWQIELAFKRLQSLLHIDRLPTRTERGPQSWLHAHLILALLCDDLSQDFLESSP